MEILKETVSGVISLMFLIGLSTLAFDIQLIKTELTIIVPDDYITIQDAINAASSGNIIFVKNGIYYEHIIVNKTLCIIGESRSNTIIDGNRTGTCIHVIANGVNISNFTIRKSGYPYAGIYLDNSNRCNISGNSITDNVLGIILNCSNENYLVDNSFFANWYFGSASFIRSNFNIFDNNVVTENGYAIRLELSKNNTISNNTLSFNEDGIELRGSVNNSIINNDISHNKGGLGVPSGIRIFDYSHFNIVKNNTIFFNENYGIWIVNHSNNNTIADNNISENEVGVALFRCEGGNTFIDNVITNNECGISIVNCSQNMIFHNWFINNTSQAISYDSVNIWDNGFPSGGNYWSDYMERYPNATEIDNSGIWNTPYIIDKNNIDYYPIVSEFPSFLILPFFIMSTLFAAEIYRKRIKFE